MSGRGRAPVKLAPDYIAALRHRYVDTDQPVREICAEFGISTGRLSRLLEREGWPRRQDRPPRQLPAAVKLLEETRRLAAGAGATEAQPLPCHPSRLAASPLAPQDDRDGAAAPPAPQDGGNRAASPLAPPDEDDVAGGEPNAITRIEQLVLAEITAEEAVRARLGTAPRAAAEAERGARTLSVLTQTLQNLQRLRAAHRDAPHYGSADDDDMPADLDEFRRDLARRIDAFVTSRVDGGDADGDQTGGKMATAR
jgi:hypothetical protein